MSAFVVMTGDRPMAVAPTLEAAQAEALRRETQYGDQSGRELRWKVAPDGSRLMSRRDSRGRFAWTQRRVVEVPEVAA